MSDEGEKNEAPGLVETVNRANLANILKKLKAGKTLTPAELDIVAGVPPAATVARAKEAEKEEADGRSRERALFWGCALRTMQIMIKEGLPVDDPEAMVAWFSKLPGRSQGMLKNSFRVRLHEERAKLEAGRTGAQLNDPDVEEFNASYQSTDSDERDNLSIIKRERAYYLFRMRRARLRKDYSGEADAAKHFRSFSDLVHECELRALKLGRDMGESFSAADVDRLGRAIGYWLMNGAHATTTQIAKGMVDAVAAGPIDREICRSVIEPVILMERVLAPLTRATLVNVGVRLPVAFVTAIRDGMTGCLEDGEAEFSKLYAMPIPLHVKVETPEALTA